MSRWVARFGSAFGVWLVVAVGAWVFGNRPDPALLALVVFTGAAPLWLYLDVSADAEVSRWPAMAEEPIRPPGEDARLERLQRIVAQHQTAHDVGDALHRTLTALADQRLVAHHGVSRLADPDRAAQILGPELTSVVTQRPPFPRLSTDRIDVLLHRIEAL
ncbi:MAG: hypothetical protein ACXWXO_05680 [Nocardioides sp.]